MTVENPVEQCAVNALPSRPGRLASRSFYLRAKQADDVFVVENTHTDLTDNLRPNSLAVMRGSLVVFRPAKIHSKEPGLHGAGATVT